MAVDDVLAPHGPVGMCVLFYEDPLTDQNRLCWRAPHIAKDANWMRVLLAAGCDARMLVNDTMVHFAREEDLADDRLFVVAEAALLQSLPSAQANFNTLFQHWFTALSAGSNPGANEEFGLARTASEAFEAHLAPALEGFRPDIIVTWAPAPHLRRMFPEALILHKETSLLSRSPFPLTYYLDPCGFGRQSFVGRESALVVDHAARAAFDRLHQALSEAFILLDRMSDLEAAFEGFDAVLLVAGHTNQVFFFDAACSYRSQAHLILDVLSRAPKSWAVLATEHPDCIRLTPTEIAFIKDRHENFVYLPQLLNRPGASQQLVRRADAVATVSSSVGVQALLWNKRLYAFGRSHLPRFDKGPPLDPHSIKPEPYPDTADDAAWWCFHYSYQDETVLQPGWLAEHLLGKLAHWKAFGAAGYFDRPVRSVPEMLLSLVEEIGRNIKDGPDAPPRLNDQFSTLDVGDDRLFGLGWAGAEGPTDAPYRWTVAKHADIRLALAPGHDWRVALHLGAHEKCQAQRAIIGVGDTELASIELNGPASGDVLFVVPRKSVGQFVTRLWLKATQIERPSDEGPPLALALGALRVERLVDRPEI